MLLRCMTGLYKIGRGTNVADCCFLCCRGCRYKIVITGHWPSLSCGLPPLLPTELDWVQRPLAVGVGLHEFGSHSWDSGRLLLSRMATMALSASLLLPVVATIALSLLFFVSIVVSPRTSILISWLFGCIVPMATMALSVSRPLPVWWRSFSRSVGASLSARLLAY
jgi:hypothetical protein